MSSSARTGPEVPPGEKRKSFSTLVSRMKTVLKRSDGSKRLSFSSRTPVVADSSAAGPSVRKPDAAIPVPAPVETPAEPATEPKEYPGATKISRLEFEADRARKLSERFRVTIEAHEWSASNTNKDLYRIEKPIRMRIHRQCHKCGVTFGSNRVCASCQHNRCTKCSRSPPKKTESKAKAKETAVTGATPTIEPDYYWNLKEDQPLVKPNPKAGGQPLVRKKPKQRIRRTCHECQTLFASGVKSCANCNHVRCADCPRDPAKKTKYPDGYPGDEYSNSTATPIKYTCHQCSKVFPAVPHPDSEEGVALSGGPTLECSRCKHERCDRCPRARLAKVEPEPDPEIVKRVEAKLAELNISTSHVSVV